MALQLKGLKYGFVDVTRSGLDGLNPQKKVPVLQIENGQCLTQSLAILEWIENSHPEPSLSPTDPQLRQQMREITLHITSDIQPLQNLAVLESLETLASRDAVNGWAKEVIRRGLNSLQTRLASVSGKYCIGDRVSLADCCFLPQYFNATQYFGIEPSEYPLLTQIYQNLRLLPECNA